KTPSGISAPRWNRRERRPSRASQSGIFIMSANPSGRRGMAGRVDAGRVASSTMRSNVTTPIHVLDLPHREARALLASTDAPVFLAMNPVEFHGPHLSLHNDRLITAGLSRDLHRALARDRTDYPYLVVDDLELGVEPASGPGSRHARFADAVRIVVEACRALVELGARRAVLNTFHGGALHNLAIDAG